MKTLRLAGIVLAVAFALAPVGLTSESVTTTHLHETFDAKTETSRYTLEVAAAHRVMRVRLKARLTRGSVTWTLTDPAGKKQWEGTLGKGSDGEITRSFDPTPGTWTLAVEIAGASGSYVVDWGTADLPVRT